MNDGGACFDSGDGLLCNLLRGNGQVGRHRRRVIAAGDRAGENSALDFGQGIIDWIVWQRF